MERETRIELAASSLADLRSLPIELLPLEITVAKCGLVRRERLELSVRRLRGDCFTRLAYGAKSTKHFVDEEIGGTGETRTRGLPVDSRALSL